MVDFYRHLAPRLRTTIVFNGDTDPCVSYEGTREAIEAVGLPRIAGGGQRPYFFNASATPVSVLAEKPLLFGPDLAVVDAGAQFGGHVTSYAEGLSFVTVHGSGHMVPQFRPRVGLHLLRNSSRRRFRPGADGRRARGDDRERVQEGDGRVDGRGTDGEVRGVTRREGGTEGGWRRSFGWR